jgi:putative transcriptional regulator
VKRVITLENVGPGKTDWERLRNMTDEEAYQNALDDPDSPPLDDDRLAKMRRVPRVKTIRRALGMTQEQFAESYHIPLGTLRDWEQGRTEPDQAARAYLQVIAKEPETVSRALGTRSAA